MSKRRNVKSSNTDQHERDKDFLTTGEIDRPSRRVATVSVTIATLSKEL